LREEVTVDGTGSGTLDVLEAVAVRRQRTAHQLQAAYLLVVLAVPAARLVPVPFADRTGFDQRVSAVLLLAAVGMRLLLRRVGPDTDWVRARRSAEIARATAWRERTTAGPDPLADRWLRYQRDRIDAQAGYFADRAERHRRSARRWRAARLVLTVGTVLVAAASLVVAVPGTAIGLVSALLAAGEAWLQFRRSEVLATSFADAREDLLALRDRAPADEAALTATVADVERVLERERWIWTAVMSATVLTVPADPSESEPSDSAPQLSSAGVPSTGTTRTP
jgi:hypothetical protein